MKILSLMAALVVALFTGVANATTVSVTAPATEILGYFNTTNGSSAGNDRSSNGGGVGDHLLGNSNGGFRNLVVEFDPTSYLPLANDIDAILTSATLVLTENSNDTSSGTAEIFAYFAHEENSNIDSTSLNTGGRGGPNPTATFWGNSGARRGTFGAGTGEPTNVNPLYADVDNVTPVSHTFVPGPETISIDLTAGGISLADIETTLADDGTSNAGIFLDSSFATQIRLQNNIELQLTFELVPEPTTAALGLLGIAGVAIPRRRS